MICETCGRDLEHYVFPRGSRSCSECERDNAIANGATCRKCGKHKPINAFSKARGIYGFERTCKSCRVTQRESSEKAKPSRIRSLDTVSTGGFENWAILTESRRGAYLASEDKCFLYSTH